MYFYTFIFFFCYECPNVMSYLLYIKKVSLCIISLSQFYSSLEMFCFVHQLRQRTKEKGRGLKNPFTVDFFLIFLKWDPGISKPQKPLSMNCRLRSSSKIRFPCHIRFYGIVRRNSQCMLKFRVFVIRPRSVNASQYVSLPRFGYMYYPSMTF